MTIPFDLTGIFGSSSAPASSESTPSGHTRLFRWDRGWWGSRNADSQTRSSLLSVFFRSASVTSPRILTSIKELFE